MINTAIKTVNIDENFITFLDDRKNVLNRLALNKISNCEILEAQYLFKKSKSPILRTLFGNMFFGMLGGFLFGLTSLVPNFKERNIYIFKISSEDLSEDIVFSVDIKTAKEILNFAKTYGISI